jgi:hypothetical protein
MHNGSPKVPRSHQCSAVVKSSPFGTCSTVESSTTLTLFGFRRRNMSVPNATDTTNPPYNSLSRSSRSSHTIIVDISRSLCTDHLSCPTRNHRYTTCSPSAPWQRLSISLTTSLVTQSCILALPPSYRNRHAMLTHWRRTCSNTSATTFATFECPFSPPSSFSLPTTFVSSLLNHSC